MVAYSGEKGYIPTIYASTSSPVVGIIPQHRSDTAWGNTSTGESNQRQASQVSRASEHPRAHGTGRRRQVSVYRHGGMEGGWDEGWRLGDRDDQRTGPYGRAHNKLTGWTPEDCMSVETLMPLDDW